MKDSLLDSLKLVGKERRIIVAFIVLTFVTIGYVVFIILNIHPSELKLVSHYSAFGTTNFYRDAWYYLISFVVFGIAVLAIHGFIALKLLAAKGTELALGFIWLSVIVIVIAVVITGQVLRVAALV